MSLGSKKPARIEVNYLYFGAFFTLLLLFSTSSIYTMENLGSSRIFFLLYSLGQVTLETFSLMFIAWMIQRFLNQTCFYFFIGATFACLLVHTLDFMMNRILDVSVWAAFDIFVLNETFSNFLLLLEASGVPHWAWVCIFSAVAAIPLLGVYLYKITERITERKPVILRTEWFLQSFLCIPCALFLWDFYASNIINPDAYTTLTKSLPWKFTFIEPKNVFLTVDNPLKKPLSGKEIAAAIGDDRTVLASKPNIYLFIVESFRDDFITPEVAPNLAQFKKSIPHFDLTFSNANGTHLSWFSIFHSQFPFYWHKLQKEDWEMGSPALNLLKKWGYQIRVYSSAHLSYYGMEEMIFGKDHRLVDSRKFFPHVSPIEAWESDSATIEQLQKDIQDDPSLEQGQVFVIFWDGTHFDYSWPKNSAAKFIPFAKEFAYFRAFNTEKNINLIKNRYRNAVNYVDSLFGRFMEKLPRKEEAIVVLTGDHGEEFFENGHLFHGSQLSHQQMNVPIFFKFGKNERPLSDTKLASQIDIFPSILDYVGGKTVPFFEGRSIFRERRPYVVTSRFNAGIAPYEFCIHNGQNKLIARFANRHNILASKTLQILSMRNCRDASLPECKQETADWVFGEFGPALEHLFPSP